jgi:hypothetical protein
MEEKRHEYRVMVQNAIEKRPLENLDVDGG